MISLTPPGAVKGFFSAMYSCVMTALCISHTHSGIRDDCLFSGIITFGGINCYPTGVIKSRRGIEMSVVMSVRRRMMFGDQADSGAIAGSVRDYTT